MCGSSCAPHPLPLKNRTFRTPMEWLGGQPHRNCAAAIKPQFSVTLGATNTVVRMWNRTQRERRTPEVDLALNDFASRQELCIAALCAAAATISPLGELQCDLRCEPNTRSFPIWDSGRPRAIVSC